MYIHNVGIFVKDLEGAKAFFESYFGATLFKTYNEPESNYYSYIMDLDGQAKLELMNKPSIVDEPKDPNRSGLAHICIHVESSLMTSSRASRRTDTRFSTSPRTRQAAERSAR